MSFTAHGIESESCVSLLNEKLVVGNAACGEINDGVDPGVQYNPLSTAAKPSPSVDLTFYSDPRGGFYSYWQPVITMDNHVSLLKNIFAIYSGKLYGDEILTAPDYSDPAYEGAPRLMPNSPELLSQEANIVCSNGGTAHFTPETQGYYKDNLLTWNFVFDNCQDGIALLNGQLKREIYEGLFVSSSGFSRDDQTKAIEYSGKISNARDIPWETTKVNINLKYNGFSLVHYNGDIEIKNSTTRLRHGWPRIDYLNGKFSVKADWTQDRMLTARVLSNLTLDRRVGAGATVPDDIVLFETGRLELSAGRNNTLLLDADTGDINTVSITITKNGSTSSVIQPWSLWTDSLFYIPAAR